MCEQEIERRREGARRAGHGLGLWLLCGLLAGLPGTAIRAAEPELLTTFEVLRAARLDGRVVAVEELVLERDVFRFELNGDLHLLRAVEGRTPGAIFLGRGRYTLTPATEGERQHIAFRTKDPKRQTLDDSFTTAAFLFSDGTEAEILAAGTVVQQSADGEAARVYREQLAAEDRLLDLDHALGLLRDYANDEGTVGGAFHAFVRGAALEKVHIGVDPKGILEGETSCLRVKAEPESAYWYASHGGATKASRHGGGTRLLVDVEHYALSSRVVRNTDLTATAEVRFTVLVPSLRVLPFDLVSTLRIEDVEQLRDGEAHAVDFVQGEEGGAALLLPQPLAQGTTATVRFSYAGEGVLEEDGVGIYTVNARSRWYPNFGGFRDRATYDLTFQVPADNTVIAVGRQIESKEVGKEVVSVWKAEEPITVAGFNYGTFKRADQQEENTGMALEVYAATGTPDVIEEINHLLEEATDIDPRTASALADGTTTWVNTYTGPTSIGVSPSALSDAAMADAINAVQIFTQLFGPLATTRLAVTQQAQWSFGQAWPSLVYLPYLVGLSKMLQLELGIEGYAGFADEVGLHEIAHQWWGHQVGWESYRDQWLSEGFAEFSTALAIELTKGGKAHEQFWERRRLAVLGRTADVSVAAYRAGPISLGFRASTERAPQAYSSLAYAKGAYVLHMLRMLMRDMQNPKPDQRFFAMMRDFATSYAGKAATTEDFEAVVERHIVPELDATGNGQVDWFFDQWVYGTQIPVLSADVKIEKAEKGKYRLVGTVAQSGVSDDFLTLVGIYADLGKERIGQIGRMPFKGTASRGIDVTVALPKKPKRVFLNANHEVLAFKSDS